MPKLVIIIMNQKAIFAGMVASASASEAGRIEP